MATECKETSDSVDFPRDATKEELERLPHEPSKVPITAWLLMFTGAVSRLAWYGVTVPWQNYLQNERGNPLLPGALGLGQAKATTIQNGFLLFQYLTPIPFAMLSDARIGRYWTMIISLGLLIVGYIISFVTSIPSLIEAGAGLGGLVVTMVSIGLGQGGLSAVMYPFIGDQLPEKTPQVVRRRDGKLVIHSRTLTIQYMFNAYYWLVNIASLSPILTTFMEKTVGFWVAFLIPTCILAVAVLPAIFWNKKLIKLPPQGNDLPWAIKVLFIAGRSHFRLSAAEPEYSAKKRGKIVPWTTEFVDEIRRGLRACRIIFCFIIFWLCYNQITNNIISQAGQMETHGIDNDTFEALNPLACIILGPVIQKLIFPFLRRQKIPFGPIKRMSVAFMFIALGMAYAAATQSLIYSRGPCFNHPLSCAAASTGSGPRPNEVNIWIQTPLHFLLAAGEILGLVSISEYAYSEFPANTKAMAQALQEISAAIGSALGIALGPVSKDPWLVILYASLAGVMGAFSIFFWLLFRRYDEVENEESTGENIGR